MCLWMNGQGVQIRRIGITMLYSTCNCVYCVRSFVCFHCFIIVSMHVQTFHFHYRYGQGRSDGGRVYRVYIPSQNQSKLTFMGQQMPSERLSNMSIKVLYLYTSPKQVSGYAPGYGVYFVLSVTTVHVRKINKHQCINIHNPADPTMIETTCMANCLLSSAGLPMQTGLWIFNVYYIYHAVPPNSPVVTYFTVVSGCFFLLCWPWFTCIFLRRCSVCFLTGYQRHVSFVSANSGLHLSAL